MTDIKTQVRQAAKDAFWANHLEQSAEMSIDVAADAAALAALEGVRQAMLDDGYYSEDVAIITTAISQFSPPHPLLARLTALEQQIAQLRQELESKQ